MRDEVRYPRKIIKEFPLYEVNERGDIYSRITGQRMRYTPNQNGEMTVGFTRDGVQYRRSVKVIVAKYFVRGETDIFDTPIILDGVRDHLHADNIVWRPRWFAWKYARQFTVDYDFYWHGPVLETTRNNLYLNIYDAGVAHGELFSDIIGAMGSDYLRVFPGGEKYVWYEE